MVAVSHWAAVCGNYCGKCDYLGKGCGGCLVQKGQLFWGTCERYICCVDKRKLEHCGWCGDFPCAWFDWNPEGLDKESFELHRQRDINNLQRRKEIGTEAWLKEQESP